MLNEEEYREDGNILKKIIFLARKRKGMMLEQAG